MASYLMKYKGKYRLKAHICQNTNDFPRDENGNLDTDDVYIKCANNCQIYHYGKSTLVAYIPSLGRGHNILFAMANRLCGITEKGDYDDLYAALESEGTIKDIVENDKEIEFKFNAKNLEFVTEFLKPQTSGAGISPFSTKNLPKGNYAIPTADLDEYKEIIDFVMQGDKLKIHHITNEFLRDILAKKPLYRTKNISADMKKKMLKSKEYIHSKGFWDEYLKYLKKRIGE